jgi:TnpA family transposase
MTAIDRTAYPRFGKRWTADELHERYGLSEGELTLVAGHTIGDAQRLTFATMLKTRQQLGCFASLQDVPRQITEHLAEQLGLTAATSLLVAAVQKKTRFRYRKAIRRQLGSRSFAEGGRVCVESAVAEAVVTMSDPADLINVAIERLVRAGIELPSFGTLDRIVGRMRQENHAQLYARIAQRLTAEHRAVLDGFLQLPVEERITGFAKLKQAPGPPTLNRVAEWASRLAWLTSLLDPAPFLEDIPHTKIRQFAAEAHAHAIGDMRGIRGHARRHTLLLCLLQRTQAATRDELALMFLRRMRRIRKAATDRLLMLQEQHRKLEAALIAVLGRVISSAKSATSDRCLGRQVRDILTDQGGIEVLGAHYETVSACLRNNELPFLWPAHAPKRAVLFQALEQLEPEAATQDRRLLDAFDVVRANRHTRRDELAVEVDLGFASQRWQTFVRKRTKAGDHVDRRALEVCVLVHLADALECGDLYVAGSEAYADYRAQLLPWDRCQARVHDYCRALGLPSNGRDLVGSLQEHLGRAAADTDAAFPDNTELSIDRQGKPHLKQLGRTPLPAGLHAFEQEIRRRMPERDLLDILKRAEHWASYTRHFGPPSGMEPKLSQAVKRYLFTVFGYGCNLGASQTARHAPDAVNRQTLRRINSQHINTAKLEAAMADVIGEYGRFALPELWGDGRAAIADGTHIPLRENNLLGERHIRYGGYGGIAYHHIANNYIALFTSFIPCGVWEAVHILDGLLRNRSDIQPDTGHADTHGQSETVFGLAYLMGIQLMPRMRNWDDVAFYRPHETTAYEHIDALFTRDVDWTLIETHWQDMMQVVLSIQAGTVLPSMLLRKLGNHNRKNRLFRAFRELGRVARTRFLLRYISVPEVRRGIRAETTKIEAFNDFLDWVSFGGPIIKSGDPVEQEKQLKYMNLVANAIMLSNVADLTDVVVDMAEHGHQVTPELVARLSPYTREHIRRFGRYILDMDDLPESLAPKALPFAA